MLFTNFLRKTYLEKSHYHAVWLSQQKFEFARLLIEQLQIPRLHSKDFTNKNMKKIWITWKFQMILLVEKSLCNSKPSKKFS